MKSKLKWLVLKFFEMGFVCHTKCALKKACFLKLKAWFLANQLCGYWYGDVLIIDHHMCVWLFECGCN